MLDNADPDLQLNLLLAKNKIKPVGAASTIPTSPATTATALGTLAAGTILLAQGVFEKRRERAAGKNTAFVSHMEDRKAGIVRTPSPHYKPPRRIVEAPLPGPDPRSAQTPEEFVSKMRQLKEYTGLTYREIEERAGTLGELPKSTLSDALKSKSLPKPRVLRHFLRACGLTDEHIAEWEATRLQVALAGVL